MRHEFWLLLTASIVVLASSLPWVAAGPGIDADSFRVFNTAKSLHESGDYSYSRPPGYPIHEYLAAALVTFGPTGTNMLSALFSVGAFVFLALVLRRSGICPYLLGALGFAFTPVVYINSTSTIDYVPAIAFVLAATYFVLGRRFIVAGVCLGISVGVRITSGAMLVPLVIWIALDTDRDMVVRSIFRFVTATLFMAAICFAPVFQRYGLHFFTFADNIGYPSLRELLIKGVYLVWGSVGAIAIIGLCFVTPLYIKRIRSRLAERQTLALMLLAAVSIAMYLGAFLRLPHEPGYLVPLIPFAIMLLGLVLPPPLYSSTCVVPYCFILHDNWQEWGHA